jgi:NTE family protein
MLICNNEKDDCRAVLTTVRSREGVRNCRRLCIRSGGQRESVAQSLIADTQPTFPGGPADAEERSCARDPTYDQLLSLVRRFASAFVREEWIEAVAGMARWISVPGGSILFKKGQPSDFVYVVVSGLFGIVDENSAGVGHTIARLGPGEIIGEMGCITGEPRSATVCALRSSEVIGVPWCAIEKSAEIDPGALLSICKTLVQRLAQTQRGRSRSYHPRTFGIVSISDGFDQRSFAEEFKTALSRIGTTSLVNHEQCHGLTTDELFQIEKAHEYVVYAADMSHPVWLRRCLGQSDAVLIVAEGKTPPRDLSTVSELLAPQIPIILLLTWSSRVEAARTAGWVRAAGASRHFHVRGQLDLQRVTRLLTGNGFGLVLSGGGARGVAHVGVMRALKEHGIAIDVIMGTSVGAFIGAGIALEWDYASMLEEAKKFGAIRPLSEITVPRVSLLAGRNLNSFLQRWFADLNIEDTPLPYSCVSTNLNSCESVIHRYGSLQACVKASSAVPGVFPPVVLNGMVHVDGGVLNNMPADLIRKDGAGFVVGVDVSGPSGAACELNIIELLTRVGCIGDEAKAALRRKECDVIIAPKLTNVGLLSFAACEQVIEAGYLSTVEKLDQMYMAKPIHADGG